MPVRRKRIRASSPKALSDQVRNRAIRAPRDLGLPKQMIRPKVATGETGLVSDLSS